MWPGADGRPTLSTPQARLAGAISGEGDGGVRRAIQGTITQLQKMSNNPHSLGRRYATSLRLLWRKSRTGKPGGEAVSTTEVPREAPVPVQEVGVRQETPAGGDKTLDLDPLNGFSWRDLDSLGQYIASNSAASGVDGMLTSPDFDWEHNSAVLDDMTTGPQFDTMWSGHDIIF